MSKKTQKKHEISVVKKDNKRPNPILDRISEKRKEFHTTKQIFPIKLDGNQKSKLISSSEFKNTLKVEKFANSDFFKALVNTYLDDPECSEHFLIKNKSRITISDFQDETILSYTPKSEAANEIILKAIQCAQILMPYTAKSILCHHNYPNCAIEIIVNGTSQYKNLLHFISKDNKNLPNAYNITKTVIEFLCTKVQDLSSSKNLYRIALTGEALSFTLDDTNEDHQINEINTSTACQTVFGQQFYNKNRLILLVSKEADDLPNQPKLDWMISNLNEEEESIQIASSLVKGIRAKHNHDIYIVKESQKPLYEISDNYKEKIQFNEDWKLNKIFQYLYEMYTSGLINEIPINVLKFVKDNEISSKREEYYKIKSEINELYQLINDKFDKDEVEKKRAKQNQLRSNLNTMKSISNKNPKKKELMDELNEINKYLHSYDVENYKIKKLLEKKSKLLEYIPNIKQFEEDIKSNKIKGLLFFNKFGGYCFSSENPISSEQEEYVQSTLLRLARKIQIDAVCIEKLVTATIYISHHKTILLSPDKFQQIISDVCKKFPFVVSHCSKYKKQENNSASLTGQIGRICIEVVCPNFARIVVSEIKKALLGEQLHKFRIPKNIASKKMLFNEQNRIIIENWLKDNNLNSIKFNGENWIGSKEEICQAYQLLENEKTSIQFPQKVIPIPKILRKGEIWKIIENHNQKIDCEKWELDVFSNCLIVGNEDVKEANEFINLLESKKRTKTDDNLLGCILVCEDNKPSELQLTVYNKDGSYNTNFLCKQCIMSTLDHNMSCFFENKIGIDFEALMSSMQKIEPIIITNDNPYIRNESSDLIITNNKNPLENDIEFWPKTPLGQLLWNLVNDRDFSDKAKVWTTEMLYKCLHLNKEVVTFCPDHPYIILKRPNFLQNLKCSIKECPKFLCQKCNEWHDNDKKCFEWTGMKCPNCLVLFEKIDGCNLIICGLCGAIWCYKCGDKFDSVNECRVHMIQMHGGITD